MKCDINNCTNISIGEYCICNIQLCHEHKSERIGRLICSICQYGENLCIICNAVNSFKCSCKNSAFIAHNNIIKATPIYTDICVDIIRYEWELYKTSINDEYLLELMNTTFYEKYDEIYKQKPKSSQVFSKNKFNILRKRHHTI